MKRLSYALLCRTWPGSQWHQVSLLACYMREDIVWAISCSLYVLEPKA
jgi:hypothetical protein